MRWRRAGVAALALILCLLIGAAVTYPAWLRWMGAFLVRSEEPTQAEVVVVLGGDYRGTRILRAAELVWQGYAPIALISGSGQLYGFHESDLAVDWAMKHGFRESLFEKFRFAARSTREEAHAVVTELRRRRVHRLLVVTSSYHTRRAGEIFREEGPELEVHVIASPDRYFAPEKWWLTREGRKTFLEEWTKTIAYHAGL